MLLSKSLHQAATNDYLKLSINLQIVNHKPKGIQ